MLSFKIRDTKDFYPSSIDTTEAEKLALENARKIIIKLSFISHNFSAIKKIFEEKEALDALDTKKQKPNLYWERYKEVLAKNDKELSDQEDDFPFALVYMQAFLFNKNQDPDR